MASTNNAKTVFVHKRLPPFSPDHARGWLDDVRSAFDERGWSHLLATPEHESTETPTPTLEQRAVQSQALAFVKQAIAYEHRYGLEDYKTAADLLDAINARYNTFSQEDEIRFEQSLTDLKKAKDKSLDEHIAIYST